MRNGGQETRDTNKKHNVADLNQNIPIIILISGLNTSIKWQQ